MPSKYLYRVSARRQPQQTGDVNRGLQVGQEVGKLLGGLAGAIKGAQKDALANRLMDEESIGDQPGAGVTQSLGKLGDGSGTDSTLSDSANQAQTAQSLGQLPSDTTFTNPATGNVEPLQGQGSSDDQLQQAIAAAQVQGQGPTVSSPQPGGPQPAQVQPAQPASSPGADDFSLNNLAPSGPVNPATVGSLVHTGGTQEMELQKEMLAQRISKASLADKQAEQSGTGRYAIDAALKRAQLAEANQRLAAGGKTKTTAADKNPPAENIASEPVIDQNQLNNHIDKIYGTGTASDIAATLNEPDTLPNPADANKPLQNPNAPQMSADGKSVVVGPEKHRITLSINEAQIYTKQANALRIKQGLPAYRVPGEDLNAGTSPTNPYIAKNTLDVSSRAPADEKGYGGWVKLPNGRITHLVRQPNGQIIGQAN